MALLDSFAPARIPAEAEALRAPVRAFLAEALSGRPPAARARTWTAWDAGFSRRLAAQGWVGLTMPRALGGAGERSARGVGRADAA